MTMKNNHNKLISNFKLYNYVENNQQMKQTKKHLNEKNYDNNNNSSTIVTYNTAIKKKGKKHNNTITNNNNNNNNNKVLLANLSELSLSIKYIEYKKQFPKVTIGPSKIRRNGLFSLNE